MTTDQYSAKLQRKIDEIERYNKPLEIATRSVLALQVRRIFIKGEAVDDSSIGAYSTVPLYVNPNNSPKKFPPKGKYGDRKFADGSPHKTGYFEGYGEFKKAIGRKDNPVNLTLSAELLKNYSNAETAGGARPIKINQHYYVIKLRELNAKKLRGNEKRFGKKISGISKSERKIFINIITKELTNAFK